MGDKDKCAALIKAMYQAIYRKRTSPFSGPKGIARRVYEQGMDLGNLYTSDPAGYQRHSDRIRGDLNHLRKLINQARKLGCAIPPDILTWVDVVPPSRPWGR